MPTVEDQLLEALSAAEVSSEFCVSGAMAPVLPGLKVKGVGTVALPVSPALARQLIEHATRAPYGRGEATIVDTDVRRVWQLAPKQFSLENPGWGRFIEGLVETVKKDLGVVGPVKAQLYKLLIYDKGSFFTSHRDSEKVDGMFATLVVGLPSKHTGGALLVKHDGETRTVAFGGSRSGFELQYATFYADCQHEIRPVTQGYRVTLVYNLVFAGRKRSQHAPSASARSGLIAERLQQLFSDKKRERIAIPLKHEYTQAGLKPDLMKGADRDLVLALGRAAEQLGYSAHLALLSFRQVGEADYDSMGYDDRYGRDDLDDASMGEVCEEELNLDHWVDLRGKKADLGKMDIQQGEVLLGSEFDDLPFEQEVTEASGNEGVTVERWYNTAVVALWPEDRHLGILAQQGPAAALPRLKNLIASAKKPEAFEQARQFARAILKNWHHERDATTRNKESLSMLRLLGHLADIGLAVTFIRDVLSHDRHGNEGEGLARLAEKLGWSELSPALQQFADQQDPANHRSALGPVVAVFAGLCTASGPMTPERLATCRRMAERIQQLVKKWDAGPGRYHGERDVSRDLVVVGLIKGLTAIDEGPRLDDLLAHILKDAAHYPLTKCLVPAVKSLESAAGTAALKSARKLVFDHCVAELSQRVGTPPEPPKDWKMTVSLRCSCKDCQSLLSFLQDPAARVGKFPLAKQRRKHIHREIDGLGLDLTHKTDRRTYPETLVCTKTHANYEKRKKQYLVHERLLAELTQSRATGRVRKTAAR